MDENKKDLILCSTVKLEAYKFTGSNQDKIIEWAEGKIKTDPYTKDASLRIFNVPNFWKGTVIPGMWIIKDSLGDFYPFSGVL